MQLSKMHLLTYSAYLLALAALSLADPGCGMLPALKPYPDGMFWCGQNDNVHNYVCSPDYTKWCKARLEAVEAVKIICNGEWAKQVFEPWENKRKCWPLHHRVVQGSHNSHKPMHVMFRMKNYRGHHAQLEPETCIKLLEIPIFMSPYGAEAAVVSNAWLFR